MMKNQHAKIVNSATATMQTFFVSDKPLRQLLLPNALCFQFTTATFTTTVSFSADNFDNFKICCRPFLATITTFAFHARLKQQH